MTEKSNALALAQLLMLHADSIENDSIKNMVIDSATELAVLHDEIERLREALKLALNSHGRMLMSDPPQDAWKFHRVDEVIRKLLQEVPR